jgi:cysteinyl-tRNA synthetase
LGETFDIHCGAEDLIFPHHENEIAQSEGSSGKPFVKYWFHVAFLNMGGEKMSKSLGNFISVRDALKKYSAESIRYFMLSVHYRSPLEYTETSLKENAAGLQRAYNCLENIKLKLGEEITIDSPCPVLKDIQDNFEEAMDDDLNSSKAMAVLFDLISELNQRLTKKQFSPEDLDYLRSGAKTVKLLGGIFGLFKGQVNQNEEDTLDGIINLLIQLRQEARARKDYATGDAIRNRLTELGIALEDSPTGTHWKRLIK